MLKTPGLTIPSLEAMYLSTLTFSEYHTPPLMLPYTIPILMIPWRKARPLLVLGLLRYCLEMIRSCYYSDNICIRLVRVFSTVPTDTVHDRYRCAQPSVKIAPRSVTKRGTLMLPHHPCVSSDQNAAETSSQATTVYHHVIQDGVSEKLAENYNRSQSVFR